MRPSVSSSTGSSGKTFSWSKCNVSRGSKLSQARSASTCQAESSRGLISRARCSDDSTSATSLPSRASAARAACTSAACGLISKAALNSPAAPASLYFSMKSSPAS